MTDSPAPDNATPSPSRPPARRKWWVRWLRRIVTLLLVLAILTGLTLLVTREANRFRGEKELTRVAAELDAGEPGWRPEDLRAAYEAGFPPAGENSADVVLAAAGAVPTNALPRERVDREFEANGMRLAGDMAGVFPTPADVVHPRPAWHGRPVGNALPAADELTRVRDAFAPFRPAVDIARRLDALPRGRFRLAVPDLPLAGRDGEHMDTFERVINLLRLDAELAAAGDRPAGVEPQTRGIVNATLALADAPGSYHQLVRTRTLRRAVLVPRQALAWGGLPEPSLARLQAVFAAESREPYLRAFARSERAAAWKTTADIAALTPADVQRLGWHTRDRTTSDWVNVWWHRGSIPEDRAMLLRFGTRLVAVAGRPNAERFAAAAELEADHRELYGSVFRRVRFQWTCLLAPAFRRAVEIDATVRADLTCAAVGLACERFRLSRGRWPETLADLPADVLPGGIPSDPFDGRPVRYRRLPDGVVVYCVGPDRKDDGGDLDSPTRDGPVGGDTFGKDVGFRLWDADQRRKPAPPPAPEEPNP